MSLFSSFHVSIIYSERSYITNFNSVQSMMNRNYKCKQISIKLMNLEYSNLIVEIFGQLKLDYH